MAVERFCLDESSLAFRNEAAAALNETAQTLIDLLDYVRALDEVVYCWGEIWHVQTASGVSVNQLLNSSSLIERDRRMLLAGRISRMELWDDQIAASADEGLECPGMDASFAPTAALAARKSAGALVATIVSDQAQRSGLHEVCVLPSLDRTRSYFLDSLKRSSGFWRSLAASPDLGYSEMEAWAARLFPNTEFIEGVWGQVGRFAGDERANFENLLATLSGLDDHAPEIWATQTQPDQIARHMSARCSVDVSPESPNTRRNSVALRQREVTVGGEIVSLQWHAKLERNRNRVHFAVRDSKVLVGIFAEHLQT